MLWDLKLKAQGLVYSARLIPLWLQNIFAGMCCLFGSLLTVSGSEFMTIMVGGKHGNRPVDMVLR